MEKVDTHARLAAIGAPWRPDLLATLNDHEVKLARLEGEFCWHTHEDTDELFLGVEGRFRIELRDGAIEVGPGDLVVVPRGVEHRPVADEPAAVLLFERAGTQNTGDVEHGDLTAPPAV